MLLFVFGFQGEALLVAVADAGQDFGEGRVQGSEGAPLQDAVQRGVPFAVHGDACAGGLVAQEAGEGAGEGYLAVAAVASGSGSASGVMMAATAAAAASSFGVSAAAAAGLAVG